MSAMMPMMMMMMAMGCCVSIAASGGFVYMNPSLFGTPTPTPIPGSSGVDPGSVDPATGLRIQKKGRAKGSKYSTGTAAKNKYPVDLGDGAVFWIQATTGSYTYMWNKRGGAAKRCDYYGQLYADSGATSTQNSIPEYAKWRFSKSTTAGTRAKPQYWIYNVGRQDFDKCKEKILTVQDATNCAGTPNGVLQMFDDTGKSDAQTWIVYRDGDQSVVFEHQGCKKLGLETRYMYLDTSKNTAGNNASLADWTGATRFKTVKVV
jgi:hypothetical protein